MALESFGTILYVVKMLHWHTHRGWFYRLAVRLFFIECSISQGGSLSLLHRDKDSSQVSVLAHENCFSLELYIDCIKSLAFVWKSRNKIKNNYMYSHPNLTSFSTQIQIHIPHVIWSAQEMHELKIDQTNAIYPRTQSI